MKFIDTARIFVKAGNGGAGHISFRREKYVPKGGPDGGNGGDGGDVIFIANPQLHTLLDFKYKRRYIAEDGEPGGKAKCTGRNGKPVIIQVPCGTQIINPADKTIIADLVEPNQKFVFLKGGRGGRGNAEFATPTNQAPRYAEPGEEGPSAEIELELKLIADVALVGFPNAGKSTLISVISSAKPKIADYPFTTLTPNLGIVRVDEYQSFVVADIPGLIEGASEGKGLGHEFLRHIERTKALVYLIDCTSLDPVKDYKILRNELKKYKAELIKKPYIIAITKVDILSEDLYKDFEKLKFPAYQKKPLLISSVANYNIEKLIYQMWQMIKVDNDNA